MTYIIRAWLCAGVYSFSRGLRADYPKEEKPLLHVSGQWRHGVMSSVHRVQRLSFDSAHRNQGKKRRVVTRRITENLLGVQRRCV